jgi:hypothetical protein
MPRARGSTRHENGVAGKGVDVVDIMDLVDGNPESPSIFWIAPAQTERLAES